jgi:hypothetical protein
MTSHLCSIGHHVWKCMRMASRSRSKALRLTDLETDMFNPRSSLFLSQAIETYYRYERPQVEARFLDWDILWINKKKILHCFYSPCAQFSLHLSCDQAHMCCPYSSLGEQMLTHSRARLCVSIFFWPSRVTFYMVVDTGKSRSLTAPSLAVPPLDIFTISSHVFSRTERFSLVNGEQKKKGTKAT